MASLKIETLQLFSYTLKLKKPIILHGSSLTTRQGLLLKMSDGRGRSTACDIAPLPHFSPDSLPQIAQAFKEIKKKLMGSFWSLKLLLSPNNILHDSLSPIAFPSLFFALEFALLSLMMPTFSLLSKVKVNLLLMGTEEEILYKMRDSAFYPALKLKVGLRSPEQTLALLENLAPYLSPGQKFRIDVNRSWNLHQTLFFTKHFPVSLCEYLEEPLKDPEDYLSFSSYSDFPLGFDESLLDTPLDYILSIPTKKAFIVKPTLWGSLQRMNTLYQKACRHKLDFVLSSSFESGLGHLMIAHLSRFLAIESPIGLDTYSWLEEDVLNSPLIFSKGSLILPKENLIKPDLNLEALLSIDV